jgi:VWFA-related protein
MMRTFLTFMPLLFMTSVTPQEQQKVEVYRFEVEVASVYVDVFVTHDGKNVAGLTSEDFIVLDRGVPQEIDLVDIETMPMSVMLVLDTSASVFGQKLAHLRKAAHAFVDGLRSVDEAGLMTFSYEWRLLKRPTQNFLALHQALNRTVIGGPTGLNDALYAGLELVETRPGRPMVLLFTDGEDNASWLTAEEILDVVKSTEAVVHIVGIESGAGVSINQPFDPTSRSLGLGLTDSGEQDASIQFLRDVAKATGGQVWFARSSIELTDIYMRVLEDMESRYLLSYEPKGVPREGWHPLEVKLKKKKGKIRARPGYLIANNTAK